MPQVENTLTQLFKSYGGQSCSDAGYQQLYDFTNLSYDIYVPRASLRCQVSLHLGPTTFTCCTCQMT